jgi:hypothetical protein
MSCLYLRSVLLPGREGALPFFIQNGFLGHGRN